MDFRAFGLLYFFTYLKVHALRSMLNTADATRPPRMPCITTVMALVMVAFLVVEFPGAFRNVMTSIMAWGIFLTPILTILLGPEIISVAYSSSTTIPVAKMTERQKKVKKVTNSLLLKKSMTLFIAGCIDIM